MKFYKRTVTLYLTRTFPKESK